MKLLYAEDEAAMSEAVVDILTYHNYLVDAVYDGEEALAYAQMEQLLSILLDNAVKYGSQGSAVRVSLRKEDRRLWLTVENACDALPQVPPEKLFHRFYRGDAARTQKSGGYGIGLAAGMIPLAVFGSLVIGVFLLVFVNRKPHVNPYIVVLRCPATTAR